MSERAVLDDLPILRFLPEESRAAIIRSFVPEAFSFGAALALEGEATDSLYVLVSGRARVIKRSGSGDEIPLSMLRAGDSFGEIELLSAAPRPHTVRASGDVLALRLDRAVFQKIVEDNPDIRTYLELQIKHRTLQGYFKAFPSFAQLPPTAVVSVILAGLEPMAVEAGETVFREGDPPGPLFLVESGRVRVFATVDGARTYVANFAAGDYFGEASALYGAPRGVSVEAIATTRLLRLNREAFEQLANALPEFRATIDARIARFEPRDRTPSPAAVHQENLPAAASVSQVHDEQVDHTTADEADKTPFEEDGRFVKARGHHRLPFVRQIDEMDCGAACVAMITRAFGRAVPLARIRQLVNVGLDGTSLRSLCAAAEELGLAARSVKTSVSHLDLMPLPAICHWDGDHWLILHRLTKRHAYLADPATGKRRVPRAEFERRWTGYAALFDYTPAFEHAPTAARGLAWLWPIVKPYRPLVVRALGLAVVVSVLQLVLPVFTQVIVDRVLVDQDVSLLRLLIIGMAGVMTFIVASFIAQRYLLAFVAVRVDAAGLDYITRRLLALPLSYFATRRTGDLQRRIEGIRQVRDVLVQHGIAGLTAIAQIVATVALMAVYSRWLTLVFLATTPLYAALMAMAVRWLRPVVYELEDAYGRYHSYQVDAIKGIETVKAAGGERLFRQMMLGQFQGVAHKSFRADFTTMGYDAATDAIVFLGLGLFLWAGAQEVLAGQLTIGGLVAFNSLVALASVPVHNLLMLWDSLQRATVMLDRLDDVFEHEPEQGHDRARLRPVRSLTGHVAFQNIGFRYGGPEAPPILQNITLEVPAGKTVAIVGRSGSGKTTLAKCLAGLLEPTEGTILLDGLDLKTLNYRDVRRQVGFVLQDSYVFAESVARNIGFGDDEPEMERVVWAARAAAAAEFIERLPFGYDTRIGETGLALSGGQRQRVSIARALYRKPPILVFDEATSSLDSESERAVQHNIDDLLKGRTSFVIAHRMSTIRNADLIIVLERGRLVEQGTHDELMRRQGLYYYLASQQLGAM